MKANMKRIVFFDGICLLCNGFVDWSRPHFIVGEIFYAPLQGKTAKEILPMQDLGLASIVYFRDGQIFKKSQAVLNLMSDMGGILKFLSLMLRAVPLVLADAVYDLVAKYRYRVFGQTETCRLPTPQEKPFFLD